MNESRIKVLSRHMRDYLDLCEDIGEKYFKAMYTKPEWDWHYTVLDSENSDFEYSIRFKIMYNNNSGADWEEESFSIPTEWLYWDGFDNHLKELVAKKKAEAKAEREKNAKKAARSTEQKELAQLKKLKEKYED